MGRAVALYTGLRVVAFVGCYGLLLIAGLRGLVAIAAALFISSIASLFVLRGPRDAVTAALAAREESRAAERARLRSLLDEGDQPREP